jgi:hypothetical protein
MRVMAQHDSIKNADKLTLNTQWWELGKLIIKIGVHEFDIV